MRLFTSERGESLLAFGYDVDDRPVLMLGDQVRVLEQDEIECVLRWAMQATREPNMEVR